MKVFASLFLILILISCSSNKKLELEKDIGLDWLDKDALFSHSIQFVHLNFDPFLNDENSGRRIDEFMLLDSIYKLDSLDKLMLVDFLVDPDNFSSGECGTFALNGGFIFIKSEIIKGIVEMGCGYFQWQFNPVNTNTSDGSISEVGAVKMTALLDSIFKKKENNF